MTRPLPADVAALVRAGLLEEVEPNVFRRPRLPSRDDLGAQRRTEPTSTQGETE